MPKVKKIKPKIKNKNKLKSTIIVNVNSHNKKKATHKREDKQTSAPSIPYVINANPNPQPQIIYSQPPNYLHYQPPNSYHLGNQQQPVFNEPRRLQPFKIPANSSEILNKEINLLKDQNKLLSEEYQNKLQLEEEQKHLIRNELLKSEIERNTLKSYIDKNMNIEPIEEFINIPAEAVSYVKQKKTPLTPLTPQSNTMENYITKSSEKSSENVFTQPMPQVRNTRRQNIITSLLENDNFIQDLNSRNNLEVIAYENGSHDLTFKGKTISDSTVLQYKKKYL